MNDRLSVLEYCQLMLWSWIIPRCGVCGNVVCEDDLVQCDDCDRRCCLDCVHAEYRNFSFFNGNVDIVSVCDVCQGYVLAGNASSERCRK